MLLGEIWGEAYSDERAVVSSGAVRDFPSSMFCAKQAMTAKESAAERSTFRMSSDVIVTLSFGFVGGFGEDFVFVAGNLGVHGGDEREVGGVAFD